MAENIAAEAGAPAPDYDDNGVDRTLTRAFLAMSPLECLQALEDVHQLAERVKREKPVPSTD